jgi:hypothetical protein
MKASWEFEDSLFKGSDEVRVAWKTSELRNMPMTIGEEASISLVSITGPGCVLPVGRPVAKSCGWLAVKLKLVTGAVWIGAVLF